MFINVVKPKKVKHLWKVCTRNVLHLTDLADDWSSKAKPDIFAFYPYTWKIAIMLKEFELSIISNEWNWVDCFGPNLENSKLFQNSTLKNVHYQKCK